MNQPEPTATISLPKSRGNNPGPLHSLVRDTLGCLYYTDEFNHTIVSLTAGGEVRWQVGGKGSGPGKFWYPRGLWIGSFRFNGSLGPCLMICDSWNHRIQVLDLKGKFIENLHSGGDKEFKETTDIRFIEGGNYGSTGYWLLLDRGNNRFCVLDERGEHLCQFGRAIGRGMEAAWAGKIFEATSSPMAPAMGSTSQVFDPLDYPNRILGRKEDSLFAWEPRLRRLRQIFRGNLYSVDPSLPREGEWVSADAEGMLSWSASDGLISLHDGRGSALLTLPFEGTPVTSDLPSSEVWNQLGDQLTHFRFEKELPRGDRAPIRFNLLQTSARQELCSHLEGETLQAALEEFSKSAEAVGSLGDRLSELNRSALIGESKLDEFEGAQQTLRETLGESITRLSSELNRCALPILQLWSLTGVSRADRREGNPISQHARLERLVRALDDAFLLRHEEPGIHRHPGDAGQRLSAAAIELGENLFHAIRFMERRLLPISQLVAGEIAIPTVEPGRDAVGSRFLKETDRIFVGDGGDSHAGPHSMTETADGLLLVTLPAVQKVLHLDTGGKIAMSSSSSRASGHRLESPAGIVAGKVEHCWIADWSGHRLWRYYPGTGRFEIADCSNSSPLELRYPVGIMVGHDDSVMVADAGNHRIVKIKASGSRQILCGEKGSDPGQLKWPVALCSGRGENTHDIWVVDQRNHRLQRFDGEGRFIQAIGRCGLEEDELLWPNSAVLLPDGNIAVDQSVAGRCVKIFTTQGSEIDCLPLDYSPGGMLMWQDHLLITEADGNHIRVYEIE